MVSLTNGQISFLDPTNFIRVPAMPVTNGVVISNLLADTLNKFPSIPINFEQPDFGALNSLVPYSSNAAVTMSSGALANAGLTPQWGSPAVTHDIIVARYTNENLTVLSVSNVLDTEVDYQFNVPGGYPLIGPGAQVQFNYGANGNATRMVYAARQLIPGPMVSLISSAVASNRAAALYPGLNPQIQPELVYYAPSLSITSVSAIIPWYRFTGSGTVTNPQTGGFLTIQLIPTLIPATDDPNFVPAVSLLANLSGDGTQVIANARITGGKPGYSFVWAGSGPETITNTGPQITYTPAVRVTPVALVPALQPGSTLVLSWYDPPQYFVVQSSSNLLGGSWFAITNPVSASNGRMSVTLDTVPEGVRFFRLSLPGPHLPQPETVTLAVSDGNGVVIKAHQSLPTALATVMPANLSALNLAPGWGVESPFDEGTQDMQDWKAGMNNPLFGIRKVDYWGFAAASFDFLDCNDPEYLPPNPYDYENPNDYGLTVGTADILFYVGHGCPDCFGFTRPWYPHPLVDADASGTWGNHAISCIIPDPTQETNPTQEWMCLLSCDVLLFTNSGGIDVSQRWLPCFDGLHLMLGFASLAYGGTGFPKVFAHNMGGGGSPVSIYQAWFDAAKSCHAGSAAVLSPLGPNAVWDIGDYWWGQGKVGPTIPASHIHGWSYICQSQ
jgi:hypothetical protein